jgi:hypothetical protein
VPIGVRDVDCQQGDRSFRAIKVPSRRALGLEVTLQKSHRWPFRVSFTEIEDTGSSNPLRYATESFSLRTLPAARNPRVLARFAKGT